MLTVDESQPTTEALAVAGGRIAAVGSRADIEPLIGSDTKVIDIGEGCVLPGLIEAHGHPLMEAIALSDRLVDIRPVTIPDADAVVAAIKAEVAKRGADGAYLNGWAAPAERPSRARPSTGSTASRPTARWSSFTTLATRRTSTRRLPAEPG